MRKIIAFTGSKQAGKTTAFNIVSDQFESIVHEVTIAGKLKKLAAAVCNIDEKHFNINELKEVPFEDPLEITQDHLEQIVKGFELSFNYDTHIRPHVGTIIDTPRQLLQFFGTDLLHPIDELVHIKHAVKGMPKEGIAVVTDLRFLHEFNYFKKLHSNEFLPFYIKNNKAEALASSDTHQSETDLRRFRDKCVLIDNNGSIEAYRGLLADTIRGVYEV